MKPQTHPAPEPDPAAPHDIFRVADLEGLPPPAAAFLRHAIAPGISLPRRVRLRMHGHIKIGAWLPFDAEQIIDRDRGFRWTARIAGGLIRGTDSYDRGAGRSHFAIGGIIPIVSADGPDVSRSALGRLIPEQAIWLPGTLLTRHGTRWSSPQPDQVVALVPAAGGGTRLQFGINPAEGVRDLTMSRWGPMNGHYDWIPFGMRADAEATFGGFTVVSEGSVGWWYGTDRWPAGEFFRFAIDDLYPC